MRELVKNLGYTAANGTAGARDVLRAGPKDVTA